MTLTAAVFDAFLKKAFGNPITISPPNTVWGTRETEDGYEVREFALNDEGRAEMAAREARWRRLFAQIESARLLRAYRPLHPIEGWSALTDTETKGSGT